MHIGYMIERNARLFPNRVAFVQGDKRVTFGEFADHVYRLINALDGLGIREGDRVAILSKNRPEYLEVYGAAESGGRIVVPLNFRLAARELEYMINDSRASAFIVDGDYLELADGMRGNLPSVKVYISLDGGGTAGNEPGSGQGWLNYQELLAAALPERPSVDIAESDIAYIMYTSGTTGTPKGAMITHLGNIEDAKSLLIELGIRPTDIHLAVMPLFHSGGRAIALVHFYRGCTTVIMRDYDSRELLDQIVRENVTTLHVVPTMIAFLLDLPGFADYDLSKINLILYASAPMPKDLLLRGMKAFGPVFVQAYGLTEHGPLVTYLDRCHHRLGDDISERRLSSCGLPAINVDVRVVDDSDHDVKPGEIGEIAARSELGMAGYWNRPEQTEQTMRDGWVYTGDLATVDEDGFIYIVDRKKDMIISGGENVYPREVEEALYTHPSVLEAAVIGVPDPVWGESVKAFVVLKRDSAATEAEIIEHCKKQLASYKKPRSVEFMDALPKSASNKILRRELRTPYWANCARRV